MTENFKSNVWIAEALSIQPVSKVLITVKADTRIDNIVRKVTEYSESFEDFDESVTEAFRIIQLMLFLQNSRILPMNAIQELISKVVSFKVFLF